MWIHCTISENTAWFDRMIIITIPPKRTGEMVDARTSVSWITGSMGKLETASGIFHSPVMAIETVWPMRRGIGG